MKKMKKLLALLLAVVMVVGFAACSSKKGDGGKQRRLRLPKVRYRYSITPSATHTFQPFVHQWIKS